MAFCRNCGKQVDDNMTVCPYCGTNMATGAPAASANTQPDEVSVGLCIVSFLIPLFGWIYWAVVNSKTPKRGRACGIAGFVGFGLGLVVNIIMTIAGAGILAAMAG